MIKIGFFLLGLGICILGSVWLYFMLRAIFLSPIPIIIKLGVAALISGIIFLLYIAVSDRISGREYESNDEED